MTGKEWILSWDSAFLLFALAVVLATTLWMSVPSEKRIRARIAKFNELKAKAGLWLVEAKESVSEFIQNLTPKVR